MSSAALRRSRSLWMKAVRDESRVTPKSARHRYREKSALWMKATFFRGMSATSDFDDMAAGCFDAYLCDIAVIEEEDGSFSAIVLNLPGVGSCGDTAEEAVENAKEAIVGVIESYRDNDESIPWLEEYDIPTEASIRRVMVNV